MSRRTVLAFPADTQVGSSFGLMPSKPWKMTQGGVLTPNPLQVILTTMWEEAWTKVAELRMGGRLIINFVGDAVQGNAFRSAEMVTTNIEEQERMFMACMNEGMRISHFRPDKGDAMYMFRGTAVHVNTAGQSEERIARHYGSVPELKGTADNDFMDGKHVWQSMRQSVHEVLISIQHHGPKPGQRVWTRENQLYNLLKSVYFDALDNGEPIPRYAIWAHNHKATHAFYDGVQGQIDGFILPCFQFHDEHIQKVAPEELASIGMLILVIDEDGSSFHEMPHIEINQKPIVEV